MLTLKNNTPLVSLGVFVHNEEKYLAKTLESLLAQDYPNLEIVISDNGSTDRTPQICQAFAKQDSRIRVFRSELNLGMVENAKRVLRLSEGEFFMWAGAHDLWSSNFVSACMKVFRAHPEAVVCHGKGCLIDLDGNPVDDGAPQSNPMMEVDTRGLKATERFRRIILDRRPAFWAICGLIRSRALKQIKPLFEGLGPDYVALAQLSLLGEFCFVPEATFYFRCTSFHTKITPEQNLDRLLASNASRKSWKTKFPVTHFYCEMLRVVWDSNLSPLEKTKLMLEGLYRWRAPVLLEFCTFLPRPVKLAVKRFWRTLPGASL